MEKIKHKHTWILKENYLVCECGKKKLQLEKLSDNILQGIKKDGTKYKVRSNRDRIFYPHEWKLFLDTLKERQRFTFKFLLITGARIMEAQNVRVDDIDLVNQRITLRVTKQRSSDNSSNKSKTRTLRVSKELIKDIRKRKDDLNLKKEDYLKLLSQPAAHIAMKNALKKAKIKDYEMLSIHSIRKTAENWALSCGVDSMKLSKRFGHNLLTQYEHYSQSDSFSYKEKDEIKELLGDTYIE
jgi:integrase